MAAGLMQVVEDHDAARTAVAGARAQHQKIAEENGVKRPVADYIGHD